MRLDLSAEWLSSFEEDEPAGFMTPPDRDELNRRRAEAQSHVEARRIREAEAAVASRARGAEVTQPSRRGDR
jgi:hypothetical protein